MDKNKMGADESIDFSNLFQDLDITSDEKFINLLADSTYDLTTDIVDDNDDLERKSEDIYNTLTSRIIDRSIKQLNSQNKNKTSLRKYLSIFFVSFLLLQYIVLMVLLFTKGCHKLDLSDTIIITYITSVFVETLGAVIFMIKFAFESSQECKILEILNNFLKNFKKYSETHNNDSTNKK